MAAVPSLALLCQKRKPLSLAVPGLSLLCSVPAPRAIYTSTIAGCAFQRTRLTHPACSIHIAARSHQQRLLRASAGKSPWVKTKRHCPAGMGTQLVPACVPCPSPRTSRALSFQAPHPSRSSLSHSDVTFVVGQEQQKVFAHRCVLACRCQAFQGMLGQGPAGSEDSPSSIPPQGPFILGNVQPEVFLAVIEFLYTNSVTLNSHIVSGAGAGRDHGHGRDKGGMQLGGALQLLVCRRWRGCSA